MKNKNNIKFVFHEDIVDNKTRRYSRLSNGVIIYLDQQFPYLRFLGAIISGNQVVVIRNITFDCGPENGKAWLDKHGNVIVRIDNPYKQTKINF